MDEQEETPEMDGDSGLSRRRLIRGAGMAAAAAWVAPTVISLTASPAMASGRIRQAAAAAENFIDITELEVTIQARGVLIATVVLNSNNQVITPPAGWTLQFQHGTASGVNRVTVAVFTTYFAIPGGPTPFTFTWGTPCTASTTITGYWGATTIEDVSDSGLVGGTTMPGPAVTVGDAAGDPSLFRAVVYVAGYSLNGASASAPPSFSNSITQEIDAVGSRQFRALPYPTAAGTFGPVNGSVVPGRPSVSGLLVVY